MGLLNPAALWLLLAVPIVFLLPRMRLPRTRRVVSNAYLWRAEPAGRPRLVVRLRRQWLLLLQAAIVLLLALAIARPVVLTGGRNVALVIDLSASMAARDGDRTRFDEARERLRGIVGGLPRASRVRLVAARGVTTDLGAFGASDPALRRAIDALAPATGTASLDDAVATARAAAGSGAAIYVITDQPRSSPGSDTTVQWTTVGHPVDNVAIVTLGVRRLPGSPFDAEWLVEVRNFGRSPRDVSLQVRHDDAIIAGETLHIEAGGARTIVRPVRNPGGVFHASIDSLDALALDNQRYAIVRSPARIPVRVIAIAGDYVTTALEVNPALEVRRVTLDEVRRSADVASQVVVCDLCTEAPATRAGLLMLSPRATGIPAPLRVTNRDHPVTAQLDLDGMVGATAPAVDVPADADVLVRAGNAPAVVAYERDGRRTVAVLLDLERSNLPLHVGFPMLLANAVDWIASADRETATLPIDGAIGVHQTTDGRLFVVNTAADVESDLRTSASAPASQTDTVPPDTKRRQVQLFAPLMLVVLLLLATEFRFGGRATSPALPAGLAMLVLLAAVGMKIPGGRADASIVFALDRSDSVPLREQSGAARRAASISRGMRDGDRAGVVVFGADALVEQTVAPRPTHDDIGSAVAATGTNIESALRLARAALSRGGTRRIVLFSDGLETTGSALGEAVIARADGVPIDVVAASDATVVPAHISRVIAPPEARLGEPFSIEMDVGGARGSTGRFALSRDGRRVATEDVQMDRMGAGRLTVGDRLTTAGAATYTAAVLHDDGEVTTQAGAVVIATDAPAVLLVSASGAMERALAQGGIRIVRTAPAAVPPAPAALARYDAVVLEDVAAEDFTAAQASALADYVEQRGGGLLVIGDARTLGPAGYPGTRLGDLLPIDLRRRAGARAPSMSLVVVFDKSGSMADRVGDVTKIELARRAVLSVLDVMPAADRLGVIAFDSAPQPVAALAPGHDAERVRERLRAIAAGGSTAIAPAVETARAWLRDAPAGRRQVLLISDGRSSDADAARVLAAVGDHAVDLSIVAIGDDADRAFFQRLATESGGRVYFPDDVHSLPEIVAREAARATGGWRVTEAFAPRPGGRHPVLAGITGNELPMLDGYVAAQLRPTAEMILVSHLGDPVFSAWRFGLGRVAVFNAQQPPAFRRAAVAGTLWRQAVRWIGRGRDGGLLEASMSSADRVGRIVVEARSGDRRFVTDLAGRAVIRTPAGQDETISLRQTLPGRYEGGCATPEAGAYLASIDLRSPDGAEQRALRGFYWAGAQERAAAGADRAFLARIAEASGGRVLSGSDDPFAGPRPLAYRDISRWLAAAALFLFLAGLASKRGLTMRLIANRLRARRSVPQETAVT